MLCIPLLLLLILGVKLSGGSQLEALRKRLGVDSTDISSLKLSNNSGDTLQVFGNFEDFSFIRYRGQENFTQQIINNSNSHDLVYYSNETFLQLIQGDEDTQINKIVPFALDSFILSGKGSLSGFQLENQLLYNLSTTSLNPIFETELSDVNAILVDDDCVYFGGNFSFASATNESLIGHSIAVWNSTSNSTSLLPFVGFGKNSIINSIVKLNDDNILFAGQFDTLDDSSLLESNQSFANNSSNVSVSSSVAQSGQLVPLKGCIWDYQEGSSFSEDSFVCPNTNKSSWLSTGTSAFLECKFSHDVTPKKIRIYNSPNESNEVSLFRVLTRPSNGIMNLTYIDPVEGKVRFCDAFCPLIKKSTLRGYVGNSTQEVSLDNNLTDISWTETFQEFAFVDSIPIEGLQFFALNSYGDSVGLSAFQIFQDTLPTFANNSLNTPDCESSTSHPYSTLSQNAWYKELSDQSFITTEFTAGSAIVPKVNFYPIIAYPGEYSINMYTPGCSLDNSCSSRGIVNVTLWSQDEITILNSLLIYQNNEELKYDNIFTGHLDTAPLVTLEYYGSVDPNDPSTKIVADFIDVVVNSFETSNNSKKNSSHIPLNGLLQYQISNFTDSSNTEPVSNTTLNQYSIKNLPNNSLLHACMYNGSLWIGGSVSGVAKIDVGNNLNVTSIDRIGTGGVVDGMEIYSEGLIMFGTFNLSSTVSSLTYNGTFNSFGNLNRTVQRFSNITLHDSELLVFDNQNIFNVSSQGYLSNTSSFSLSLWAAAQNFYGDLVFSGGVSESGYSNLNGSISIIGSNSSLGASPIEQNDPYLGVFLNSSLSAYAIRTSDGLQTELIFDDGRKTPWKWAGSINSMLYSDEEAILAVGSSDSSQSSLLTIFDLRTSDVIANETMNNGSTINSMVYFEKNSTILVGGNFSLPDSSCSDLCLYSYDRQQWSKLGNNSITGNVKQIQVYSPTQLLISGALSIQNKSYIGVALFNVTSYSLETHLDTSIKGLNSFSTNENRILSWNETNMFTFENNKWENIALPDATYPASLVDVCGISLGSSLGKRDTAYSESLLVMGQFRESSESSLQAFLYDFETWLPYYVVDSREGSQSEIKFFSNEDVSKLSISNLLLSNPNKTISVSTTSSISSTTSATSTSNQPSPGKDHKKIDRGFVVLIGLALAVGTVTIIGTAGVLFAYFFKENEDYAPIYSRADEAEMINSVPPEKLLQFL